MPARRRSNCMILGADHPPSVSASKRPIAAARSSVGNKRCAAKPDTHERQVPGGQFAADARATGSTHDPPGAPSPAQCAAAEVRNLRRLRLLATSVSCPRSSQRNLGNPCARMPHSRKASNSYLMNGGSSPPVLASVSAMKLGACCCTRRYSVVCSGRWRS